MSEYSFITRDGAVLKIVIKCNRHLLCSGPILIFLPDSRFPTGTGTAKEPAGRTGPLPETGRSIPSCFSAGNQYELAKIESLAG